MRHPDSPRRDGAPPARQVFGMEHEYGYAEIGPDGRRREPEASLAALMRELKRAHPHLHCRNEHDVFLGNGSRVYIDFGLHPEVATPECSTPEEVICYTRAGDEQLLRAAAAAVARQVHVRVRPLLWKGNLDYRTGATWASHESISHLCRQDLLAAQLMPHLVTRPVYAGAGGFDNRADELRFLVSPRAAHLRREFSADSTRDRGIFHTRDEPLAAAPNRRLHLLCGESLWSETADYLRIGTTALLVAQVDAGRRPADGLELANPVQALAVVAADVSCRALLTLRRGGRLGAIAIQRRLLEFVEADLGADHLPPWAAAVCQCWRSVLNRLQRSPRDLAGVLDWPTKLSILQRQSGAQGLEWRYQTGPRGSGQGTGVYWECARTGPQAARLLASELQFNRLDDLGTFASLDRQGLLTHRMVSPESIEQAIQEPPASGRARVRSACIHRLSARGSDIVCDWDRIVDFQRGLELDLGDPFSTQGERWIPLRAREADAPEGASPYLESIASAMRAAAPARALQRMRGLLVNAESLPNSSLRYCAGVIGDLVPTLPVPVLGRGAASAGPTLTELHRRALASTDYRLQRRVGTLLYRWYEARGRYARARRVIERMLDKAQEVGDRSGSAELFNNLGFEYLMEGRWEQAEARFHVAITRFTNLGMTSDVVNSRANLLECSFALTAPGQWHTLAPTLRELNRALVASGDWRARKTLTLLARLAEQRGRLAAARRWQARAVAASVGLDTQLRGRDIRYLEALQRAAPRRARR